MNKRIEKVINEIIGGRSIEKHKEIDDGYKTISYVVDEQLYVLYKESEKKQSVSFGLVNGDDKIMKSYTYLYKSGKYATSVVVNVGEGGRYEKTCIENDIVEIECALPGTNISFYLDKESFAIHNKPKGEALIYKYKKPNEIIIRSRENKEPHYRQAKIDVDNAVLYGFSEITNSFGIFHERPIPLVTFLNKSKF